jgi:phage protein D
MITAALDAVPIYEDNDFYVPTFEVKVGDTIQGAGVIRDILQVSYKDDIDTIDSFEISINNWDADKRRFKYSDSHLFDPGKKVELSMGYLGKGQVRKMIRGEITSLRPTFPASGASTLAISGLNVLHRFRREQFSDVYERMTDWEIAKKICGRLGVDLLPRTSPVGEPRYEYVLQSNQFDILFLLERARRAGYELVAEEDQGATALRFGPSGNVKKVTYQLTYGRSLIHFQPTLTTAQQVSQVTVRAWNAREGKAIEKTVTRKELKTDALAQQDAAALEKAFSERREVSADRVVRDENEAKQLAMAILQNIANDMVKGSGSVVGLPDLRAGTILVIDGLGGNDADHPGTGRFDGRYFVMATTHTIGSGGYTTQFECRREEQR